MIEEDMDKLDKLDKIIIVLLIILLSEFIFFAIFKTSRIIGVSMCPTINNDSFILIQTIFLPSNLTNNIIVFQWNSTMTICHRCIMDNGTHILTKGDNNPNTDGWIPKTSIIGIVVWIVKQ